MKALQPAQVAPLLATEGGTLLDVRSEAEFANVHAAGAINIPLDRLDAAQVMARVDRARPVYCICASGVRSAMAMAQLERLGLEVVNVAGGTQAWAAAGLPVARG
jgi:rhodanese-related sulfurtransferase